ncbi:uncharacterized protein LODBEIA_P40590 [Lodderomyces beijingensis]|uniref:Ribonuclease H n=1 Tax=Lodderomyces beijingensis TaxID=1775926 RepID=A0ABP0ZNV6_9ASCO
MSQTPISLLQNLITSIPPRSLYITRSLRKFQKFQQNNNNDANNTEMGKSGKYYAVAKGRNKGVYSSWNECKVQVQGYSGASFKSFTTLSEAKSFVNGGKSSSSTQSRPSHSSSDSSSSLHAPKYKVSKPSTSTSTSKPPSSTSTSTSTSKSPSRHRIYVDGASRGNGKSKTAASGYGVYYGPNDPRNAAVPLDAIDNIKTHRATNQRAELHAINHALKCIHREMLQSAQPQSVQYAIYSDSKYAMDCICSWAPRWSCNGWKTSTGQPVANVDIIKEAVALKREIDVMYVDRGWSPLSFHHVRGHSGEQGNEEADRLANLGADMMKKY